MGEREERNGVIIFKIKKIFFKKKNSERTLCLILTSDGPKSRFEI